MMQSPDINAEVLGDISSTDGSLAQRVYNVLKHAILTLAFPPGAVLRKAAICDRLNVSRAPVSEAIARLATEGLVDVIPQSGTRVSYFSIADIREGAFLREALELAAVARVADDLTEEQARVLGRNLRMQTLLVEDGDFAGFYQSDEEFHTLLMQFTGFVRLASVAETFSLQVSRARVLLLPKPGRLTETLAEHRAIFEAIQNRDAAGAQAAMRHHLGQLMPRIEQLEYERPDLFNTPKADTKRTG